MRMSLGKLYARARIARRAAAPPQRKHGDIIKLYLILNSIKYITKRTVVGSVYERVHI